MSFHILRNSRMQKKSFLKISQSSQKNTCAGVYIIKKENLTQVFSCEFCETFKNTSSSCFYVFKFSVPTTHTEFISAVDCHLIVIVIFKINVKYFLLKSRNLCRVFPSWIRFLQPLVNVCALTLVIWQRLKRRLISF